ncbi:MAG: hypothetical protein SFY96_06065 [Planctomycetota bacterium]|nr:hypothetical protein [Planctomycetota bacterium]
MTSRRATSLSLGTTCVLMLALSAGLAGAQIAPPPPEAPAKTPDYVPPPMAPATPRGAVSAPPGGVASTPDIPFKDWEKDENGKLAALDRPLEWAAMDRNVTLTPKTREAMEPYLIERKQAFEDLVVVELKTVRKILDGELEKIDLTDTKNFGAARDLVKPLTGAGSIMVELKNKGIVSRIQAAQNQKIMKAYQSDLNAQMKKEHAAKPDATDEEIKAAQKQMSARFMRDVMLKMSTDEAIFTYKRLSIEAGTKMSTLLPTVEAIPADLKAKLAPLALQLEAEGNDNARAAAYREVAKQLTVEQEQALLTAVRMSRPVKKDEPAKPAEGEAAKPETTAPAAPKAERMDK